MSAFRNKQQVTWLILLHRGEVLDNYFLPFYCPVLRLGHQRIKWLGKCDDTVVLELLGDGVQIDAQRF